MATHAPSAHQGKSSAQPIAAGGPADRSDPAYQAFLILRTAFTIAPILFGLDKFFDVLTDWDRYLSGPIDTLSTMPITTPWASMATAELRNAHWLSPVSAPKRTGPRTRPA